MAGEPWTVPCRDVAGRVRAVNVSIGPEQVVLHLPAGESAVFARAQTTRLRHVLGIAADALRLADIQPDAGGEPR